METISCNYCGSPEAEVLATETAALNLQPPFAVVRCRRCGLMFMNPRMTSEEYKHYYSSQYFEDEFDYGDIVQGERIPKFSRRLQQMAKWKPGRGKLLDVGTATGEFLDQARRDGWQVFGTEVSEYAAGVAKNKFQLDLYVGQVEHSSYAEKSFDIIHMSHVLEHVPDPRATLKALYRLLKDDGLLIIEVPFELHNSFVWMAQHTGRFRPPQHASMHHTYFYTPQSLKKLMVAEHFSPRIRTYSLDIPSRALPAWTRLGTGLVIDIVDHLGGGLYIETLATKVHQAK